MTRLKHEVAWQSRFIHLFGKDILIPRLEHWTSESDVSYTYSGQKYCSRGWLPCLHAIVKRLSAELSWSVNGALLNYYRNGDDSMGWHADNEPELGKEPVIAILSLGSARTIAFRLKEDKTIKLTVILEPGSLLVMKAKTQSFWQHSIPKRRHHEERISVTFREIKKNL